MISTKAMSLAFGLALAAMAPAAMAATIAPGPVSIAADNDYDYQGTFNTNSGARTLTFDLTALNDLVLESGVSTLEFTGRFANLSVTLDGVDATLVYDDRLARAYSFDTTAFMAGDAKALVLSWDDVTRARNNRSGVAQINLQMTTATVPLPAGGLLLIGALAGLAALRRRKSV